MRPGIRGDEGATECHVLEVIVRQLRPHAGSQRLCNLFAFVSAIGFEKARQYSSL